MRRRAFTILEVMLAVGLLVLLTGGMYAFLWNLLSRREALAVEAARDQAAGTLFERLEADLTGAVAGDAKHAGVAGTASEIAIRGRGVAMPLRSEDRDAALADMHGMQVAFGDGALRGRRWVGEGEPSGEFQEISADVQRVRFRYSDGRQWRPSFNSAETGTLPVAVEVAVWFGTTGVPEQSEEGVPGGEDATREGAEQDGVERQGGNEPANQEPRAVKETRSRAAVPTREPDRRRLIIVPDGPVAAWKESTR